MGRTQGPFGTWRCSIGSRAGGRAGQPVPATSPTPALLDWVRGRCRRCLRYSEDDPSRSPRTEDRRSEWIVAHSERAPDLRGFVPRGRLASAITMCWTRLRLRMTLAGDPGVHCVRGQFYLIGPGDCTVLDEDLLSRNGASARQMPQARL